MRTGIILIYILAISLFVSCESPLEPVSADWFISSIEHLERYETITTTDDSIILGRWNLDNGHFEYYEYKNGELLLLFSLPKPGYTDSPVYKGVILDDCNYHNGILWACGDAIKADYGYHPLLIYYENGKLSAKYPPDVHISDPYIYSIVGYNTGSDKGCYFSTDKGLFKYTITHDHVDFIAPGYRSLCRSENGLFYGLNSTGGAYQIGIWNEGETSITEESVPIFNEAWNYTAPDASTPRNSLISPIDGGLVFVVELAVDDIRFQGIVYRDDMTYGVGKYEYLMVNPMGGPYGDIIKAVAGVDKNNIRAVGKDTSFAIKNGEWLKEKTGYEYIEFYDLTIFNNQYWAPVWFTSSDYSTESVVFKTDI